MSVTVDFRRVHLLNVCRLALADRQFDPSGFGEM
jgi:hypothetical protein